MAQINLDAARAARREAESETPTVLLDGNEFALPNEVPFEVVEVLLGVQTARDAKDETAAAAGITRIVRVLLGDNFDAFMAARPSMNDLAELVDGLASAYGFADSGESQASADSS